MNNNEILKDIKNYAHKKYPDLCIKVSIYSSKTENDDDCDDWDSLSEARKRGKLSRRIKDFFETKMDVIPRYEYDLIDLTILLYIFYAVLYFFCSLFSSFNFCWSP